ncbi:MAG: 4-hydroxybenzoate octaprenyltransferase, partial [Gammaproteobacteria bacterium]
TNALTIALSFAALALAATYPFMKRYTHLPQVVLGAAFSFGIPMAFAAQTEHLPKALWLLYFANLSWTVAYDTQYAMVDRDDDLKVGIKSTAVLFGRYDRHIIALLQVITLVLLALTGIAFGLTGIAYIAAVLGVGLTFVWQQYLIKDRERDKCFQGFLNNHYSGMIFFAGVVLDYVLRT